MRKRGHKVRGLLLFLILGFMSLAHAGIPEQSAPVHEELSGPRSGEVVVVDAGVADYVQLIDDIGAQGSLVVLGAEQDGLQQLAAIVGKHRGITALHIFSHGAPGLLRLGGSEIRLDNLSPDQQKAWQAIGRSLAGDGDILLYGCNIGAGSSGLQAVRAIAALTKADISASTNVTGHADKQGDWKLELRAGSVETAPLRATKWRGTLMYCYEDCRVVFRNPDGDDLDFCRDPCPDDPDNNCGVDLCPDDPDKVAPGSCGCGVPDIDTDHDHHPDCIDANPLTPGGYNETLTCSPQDECPDDPEKTDPGICGCGVADTDSDGDGTADCNDGCPADMSKTEPGTCGCGVADTDSDGDGTADCNDGCPHDMSKTEAGTCGCGVADTDSDGDGTVNCNDGCPYDMNKTEPGTCGCGVADVDQNGDGTPDCVDLCPDDPEKSAPGICGCGVADTDSDGDGTADCNDGCPHDMNKTEAGQCGCGIADVDQNGNGTPDCLEQPGGEPGFPWILFIRNFVPRPGCPETPDYCYMVADGDSDTSENSPLLKYDFRNDSLQLIGRLGVGMVEAITLSLDGKTLYGCDNGTLGIIDTTPGNTSAFTPINAAGVGSGNGSLGLVTMDDIDGLAFDPVSGKLYGSARRFDGERGIGVDLLIIIDPQTGTLVKDAFGAGKDYVVIDTQALNLFDIDDLAIDSDGVMYGIATISGGGGGDRLVVIDKATGTVTDRGELLSGNMPVQDMEGLTFYHGGSLYGTTGYEFDNQGTNNTLYRIDKASGKTQFFLRLDNSFDGLVPIDFESITCPVCE